MVDQSLTFSLVPGEFAVCRLNASDLVPAWADPAFSVTRTREELSIVCCGNQVPEKVTCERGWACFKLEGPFPFTLTGVLASFLRPLAKAKISIFAVSTFDTDYVLVKRNDVDLALAALRAAGHQYKG